VAFVLGLTGNIACGKSSVGALLAERFAADYLDADRVVHERYAAGTPETLAIAERFGSDLLTAEGTIDRRRLGDIVMADRSALRELERILDPGVRATIEHRCATTKARVIVLDAIRLIEGGLYKRCNAVWVVACDRDVQVERLQRTRNFSLEQAQLRVSAQVPIEEKLQHASAIITNNGSLDELQRQVEKAWAETVRPYLAVHESPP
jgi:dephospho-CoA kinase